MEEELLRRQALNETVLDESTRLRAVIVLLIVRQRTVREPIGNTATLGRLLPHTRHHLRNINRGPLRSRTHHRHQTVLIGQRAESNLTSLLRRLVQLPIYLVLELLAIRLARVIVEKVHVNLEQGVLNRHLPLLNHLLHLLPRLLVRNQVRHAHREAIVNEELLNRILHRVDEVHRIRRPVVLEHRVNDALGRLREDVLVEDALLNLALENPHEVLLDLVVLIEAIAHRHIDRGEQLADNLLARPPLLAADFLRTLRYGPLETPIPHHHIHKLPSVEIHVGARDTVGAHQRILYDTNHRLRMAGRDDLVRDGRNLQQLRRALVGLRDVRVHLIAVKIRIVGRRDGYVQAERIVGQHFHTVPHHRHTVQRRLPVEEHDVPVHDVAIHDVAHVQHNLLAVHVLQARHAPVGAHDGLRARVALLTIRPHILNELIHLRNIVGRHLLRKRQIHRNLRRHPQLRDGDVRIRRNHGTRGELHTLSLNVVADAALLGPQTLLHRLQRTTGALGGRRHAGNLVIHERRHVILEHRVLVLNQILPQIVIDLVLEAIVRHDDLEQLVGQVVLGALIVVLDDGRAHLGRRNRHDGADHPIRATPEAVEAHEIHVLVRDATEEA